MVPWHYVTVSSHPHPHLRRPLRNRDELRGGQWAGSLSHTKRPYWIPQPSPDDSRSSFPLCRSRQGRRQSLQDGIPPVKLWGTVTVCCVLQRRFKTSRPYVTASTRPQSYCAVTAALIDFALLGGSAPPQVASMVRVRAQECQRSAPGEMPQGGRNVG